MLGTPRHPSLLEADSWASEHAQLLVACFGHFCAEAAWPRLETLQHDFEATSGADIDVHALAWGMPKALGFPEGGSLVLLVRGLSHVPAAAGLLADWHAAFVLAYARWREDETAQLRRSDLRELYDGDEHRVRRVSRLILRESWAFSGGTGDETGEWTRGLHSQIRAARDTRSASELLAARDAAEFPVHPPTEPVGIDEEAHSTRSRLKRGWDLASHHPMWSAVLAGLILAAIGAAGAGVWSLGAGDGEESAAGDSSAIRACDKLAGRGRSLRSFVIGEGQVEGGNILRARSATGSFGDPLLTEAGADVTVGLRISNPGPGDLTDARVRVTLDAATDAFLRLRAYVSARNAFPRRTTDSLVINLAGRETACASYVNGSTEVRIGEGPARSLPDGICQDGVNIGEVHVPLEETQIVTFRIHLEPDSSRSDYRSFPTPIRSPA